jgi:hypothetical protein
MPVMAETRPACFSALDDGEGVERLGLMGCLGEATNEDMRVIIGLA